jgi:hypothetical protein
VSGFQDQVFDFEGNRNMHKVEEREEKLASHYSNGITGIVIMIRIKKF